MKTVARCASPAPDGDLLEQIEARRASPARRRSSDRSLPSPCRPRRARRTRTCATCSDRRAGDGARALRATCALSFDLLARRTRASRARFWIACALALRSSTASATSRALVASPCSCGWFTGSRRTRCARRPARDRPAPRAHARASRTPRIPPLVHGELARTRWYAWRSCGGRANELVAEHRAIAALELGLVGLRRAEVKHPAAAGAALHQGEPLEHTSASAP